MHRVSRRAVLAATGAAAFGGCVDVPAAREPGSDLPEECPVTQDLGVEWPQEITAGSVASFLESYEYVYHRDVVVEYEPGSMVDDYRLSVHVSAGPTTVEDGYRATVYGGGAVYTPTLNVVATSAEAPPDADVVPRSAVEDDSLRNLLANAAADGRAEFHVDRPGEPVDRYIELVASLSADFEPLSDPGDSGTAYFEVDRTTVELTVSANRLHGDYGWRAPYYVDDHVVRRSNEWDGDPTDGELLECRDSA